MRKIFVVALLGMLFSLKSFAQPGRIIGPDHVCVGSTVTYTDSIPGGGWSSLHTGIATIDSVTGVLTGVSPGVDSILYGVPGLGYVYKRVTIDPTPAISGPTTVVTGGTITLVGTPPGGVWSSACPGIVTVNPVSGVVTGIGPGGCSVVYTLPSGCHNQIQITDSGVAISPITGDRDSICVGSTVALHDATPGGTWSSSSTAIATVSPSGLVTGMSNGAVIITYAIGASFVTYPLFVEATPVISGASSICVGGTTTFTSSVSGGFWSSSNSSIATVNSSGVVSGVGIGTAVITYNARGCFGTRTISVTTGPAAIAGPSTVGIGTNITLTDATSGGTWSSSNSSIVMIGSVSGVATGISLGVCTISYSVGSCIVTKSVTVTATSGISAITGASYTCVGTSTLLSDATPGGTWTSSNTAIATVSSTGLVTGISVGSVTITYTVGSAFVTRSFTVIASSTITGPTRVCVGNSITLTGSPTGGSWISGSTSIASVGSTSGVVTGLTPGVVTIYYSLGGCYAYKVVTVTAAPAAIAGTATTTVGGTSTLTDATSGGTWSSSNTAIATIGSTGIVTGIAAGTCTITYTVGGCYVVRTFTVTGSTTVAPISGASSICIGLPALLTDATPGGTWSSSNTSIATVTSTGVVMGVAAGTCTITYTVGSAFATLSITVGAPPTVSGPSSVCVGSSITLTGTPTGGTWSSSNPSIASVSSGGVVTGVNSGSVTISYSVGGCFSTKIITVNPAPAAIGGVTTTTVGGTSTLTDATPGGTWASSNTSIATISAGGVVTGVAVGTCTITYYVAGCFRTVTFTVTGSTIISPIIGTSSTCVGSSVTLTDATGGGTWSASDTTVARISSTGVVTGVGVGTCTITYTVGSGFVTTTFIVLSGATISGSSSVCIGSTITLAGSPAGGTWSSSNTTIATVSSAGVVTGVAGGVVNITYVAGGCSAIKSVTVNSSAVITGGSTVCVGSSLTLSATPSGGTWSSSSPAIATVSSTGVVSGVTTGTVNIYYSTGGCFAYRPVTVSTGAVISGGSTVCIGGTTSLSATPSGGSWSSSSTGIATVTSTGLVTGVGSGVATISYTTGGCSATRTVSVSGAVSISGGTTVCVGSSITLTGGPTGGTWSSSSTSIATITSGGVVTGIATGTVVVTYTSGSCSATRTITVGSSATITGGSTLCAGSSITLTGGPSGGTWICIDSTIAFVSSTGVVTGLATGVATIYYTTGGCSASKTVTVTPGATISGGSAVCVGTTITLTGGPTGGTWSSSNTSLATVSSTGVVTGVAVGTVTISYTSGGCTATRTISVGSGATITGSSSVCTGSSITLTGGPVGGTWTSGNTSIATVTSTGFVTGVTAGVVNIYYSAGSCSASKTVTVNAGAVISGSTSICIGSTTTLSATPAGGTWTSGNTSIATVSSTGVVSPVSVGTVNIYYTTPGGCSSSVTITISSGVTISGGSSVCIGSSITLTGSPAGGTWTSGNTSIAAVSSTGVVNGVTAGVVNIYYSAGSCSGYKTVTVNPAPTISGITSMCTGSTSTFTASPTGGSWSSSNTSVATVSSTGLVTAVSAGVVNIYYTTSTGCSAAITVTVNAGAVISGTGALCAGSSTTLSATPSGGTWLSGNTSIATITSGGVVSAVASGVVNIYYTTGGCSTVKTVTVTAPAAITGPSSVCSGTTITLAGTPAGGTWRSSDSSIITVSSAGVVRGIATGSATITYSVGGCVATRTILVNSGATISGPSSVCTGSVITLSGTPAGGTWSSGFTGIAIVSTGGVVTGMGVGIATIYYSIGGCYIYKTVSVNGTPAAISGPSTVCPGSTIALTDPTSGGSWSSGSTSTATVSTGGIVTGVTAGTVNIYYAVGSCGVSKTITVNPAPAPIAGVTVVRPGSSITLTDATPGGTWLSSNPSIASVNPTTGVVTGRAIGTVTIYYSVGGCSVAISITVSASGFSPVAAPDSYSLTGSAISTTGAKHTATNGVSTIASEDASLSVYPNPTSGNLNIQWQNQQAGAVKVSVSDIIGREVYHSTLSLDAESGQSMINLSELKDGIYIISIKSDAVSYSNRLIIRK